MKLHLYQSIPYLVTGESQNFTIDFFSPKNSLKYLHSQIALFAGNNYSCQEAAIFGKWKPGKNTISLDKCTAGFSLISEELQTVPVIFSEDVFHSGSYVFLQFDDSSPEGIKNAVKEVSDYLISHQLQLASDTIMLRMVLESGGLLAGDLQNFAFQVCVALSK